MDNHKEGQIGSPGTPQGPPKRTWPWYRCCCFVRPWSLAWTFLQDHPVFKLILVIFFNGLVSMMWAAIFIQLEGPSQKERLAKKNALKKDVASLRSEIVQWMANHSNGTLDTPAGQGDHDQMRSKFERYTLKMMEYHSSRDEIEWTMLSACEFVNSVATTTGYGRIVPVTLGGKICTVVYALYGIPIFLWYIVKLGSLFRVLVLRTFSLARQLYLRWIRPAESSSVGLQLQSVLSIATSQPPQVVVVPLSFSQEMQDEKKFHPLIIGVILIVYLLVVAAFISYMETITYFDAFYASFITYSTIGFGDIDIYNVSYRSSWFNLMIYGNGVHVFGYMLVSAWVSALLYRASVQKA